MISDPVWWQTFDYKLTLVGVVFTSLGAVAGLLWKMSRKYTEILAELKNKVSHKEMSICKTDITEYIEKSTTELKKEIQDDIKDDNDANRSDHSRIEGSIMHLMDAVMLSLKGND